MGPVLMRWLSRTLLILLILSPLSSLYADNDSGPLKDWPVAFDGRLPRGMPPGDGWKVVSGDGTLTSSDCIGDFYQPECIVDTMMACDARSPMDEPTSNDGFHLYYWHPLCEVLRPFPGEARSHVRSFAVGGSDPDDIVFYYKTIRFTLTEEMIPDWPNVPGEPCRWCVGDIVIAAPLIICAPSPEMAIPPGSNIRWIGTFQPDSRTDTCWPMNWRVALISRLSRVSDGWIIAWIHQSHGEGPFPALDKVYEQDRLN